MAIRVALNHRTTYRYDRRVALSPHVLRLRPAPHCRTPILAYSLKVQPEEHFLNWQQDPFGNFLARFVFPEATDELSIEVELVAELTVVNPFDFFVEEYAKDFPFAYEPVLARDLAPYLEVREQGPKLTAWLASVDRSPRNVVDFLVSLNQRLQGEIGYTVRLEPGVQTCEQTLERGTGSCRDSGWLLVQILRHLGLAARFASGYLVQLTADEPALDGPSGPAADFTDLHAWAEVFVPGAGWIGLDPTSGLFAGEGHIPLACTPDPESAAPVTGLTGVCETTFAYANTVRRIHEDPRVTRPYSGEQWRAVEALARRVDEDLAAADVRLTQGGEPTFVSIDDMDGAEWNTAALGAHKLARARELLLRLRARFAPGGVLHYGQGKWYPGEPLPRWALGCFWRPDGAKVWTDPARLADVGRDYGHGRAEAERFAAELARRLGLAPEAPVPGYEDVLYTLWQEGTLPANVDPMKADLKDDLERRRLARLLEQGLGEAVGYALPVRWTGEAWATGPWEFRRGRMFLLPGDSPMGLRLPLGSLVWVDPPDREVEEEPSPLEARPPLGDVAAGAARRAAAEPSPGAARKVMPGTVPPKPDDPDVPKSPLRTALCVEAREGRVHVFLPPIPRLEPYLDLVASIEAAAKTLDLPVVLEGYEPPEDPRLKSFRITPDPGVIEVNIHPATGWDELAANTTAVYEEARLARLGAEKFMLDGRHTGTGGGNHVTFGGATPADSPFLRRPDLLRSLVTYWQHHPSLSYLFSGLFLGPTSQAPRVDEARNDSLYELEIAFQETPAGEAPAPWLVDRLYRNLLVDATGNTHRAEFCIDKLYSPDSQRGRLGLLELRGFEMPPHARMSLMQALLLRGLVARFWHQPYEKPLVRWGTELHDRFLLPHYVWSDLRDVVADLNAAGYPFDPEWFAPFQEFRFPHYGRVQVGDVGLELRFAIEPWHVLGEEVTSGGTARFVDSSLERVQVRAEGLTGSRHVVTCNGRRVPLAPTGTHGEFVAGVRFRAWQPYSALHPTIPSHAPLVFDLLDTWNGRSARGCTYHVAHPAGRNYETFPVNANEAEARRIARFWPHGHTPGPMTVPPEERNPEFPHTLDLRRRAGG
ncbi:MAG: transglutaminase family protein [Deferrisomatales bacterium]